MYSRHPPCRGRMIRQKDADPASVVPPASWISSATPLYRVTRRAELHEAAGTVSVPVIARPTSGRSVDETRRRGHRAALPNPCRTEYVGAIRPADHTARRHISRTAPLESPFSPHPRRPRLRARPLRPLSPRRCRDDRRARVNLRARIASLRQGDDRGMPASCCLQRLPADVRRSCEARDTGGGIGDGRSSCQHSRPPGPTHRACAASSLAGHTRPHAHTHTRTHAPTHTRGTHTARGEARCSRRRAACKGRQTPAAADGRAISGPAPPCSPTAPTFCATPLRLTARRRALARGAGCRRLSVGRIAQRWPGPGRPAPRDASASGPAPARRLAVPSSSHRDRLAGRGRA